MAGIVFFRTGSKHQEKMVKKGNTEMFCCQFPVIPEQQGSWLWTDLLISQAGPFNSSLLDMIGLTRQADKLAWQKQEQRTL